MAHRQRSSVKDIHEPGTMDQSPPTTGRQPPQGSQRRPQRHLPEPEERRNPERQGERPSPGEKEHPSMQGFRGTGGARGARSDDVQEMATSGEPRSTHTRGSRQKTPGDRSNR